MIHFNNTADGIRQAFTYINDAMSQDIPHRKRGSISEAKRTVRALFQHTGETRYLEVLGALDMADDMILTDPHGAHTLLHLARGTLMDLS